jgi:hypothetical protein
MKGGRRMLFLVLLLLNSGLCQNEEEYEGYSFLGWKFGEMGNIE